MTNPCSSASPRAFPVYSREKPYDFQSRITCIHPRGFRARALLPAPSETEITAGWRIVIPEDAPALHLHAAEDLKDFLEKTMEITLGIERRNAPSARTLFLGMDPASAPAKSRAFRCSVTADRAIITGFDDRGVAQGAYFLEHLMKLRRAPFLAHGETSRTPRFSPRMIHSAFSGDVFPDDYLNTIAHSGLDSIVIYVHDKTLDNRPAVDEINDRIARAARFGLDAYLYPTFHLTKHPLDEGAMEFYDHRYGRMLRLIQGARGVVCVGESCAYPSRDPRASDRYYWTPMSESKKPGHVLGFFPFADFPDWTRFVEGILRSVQPDIEFVMWTYNWGWAPDEDRIQFVRNIPDRVILEATFEMFEKIQREGLAISIADYSVVFPGPGHYFTTEAAAAKECGRRLYAMTNTGGRTWDLGVIPYDPVPYLWKKRWDAILAAHRDWGLSGLMESHHYGWSPSFISELSNEAFRDGGMDFDTHIRRIAERDFGAGADEAIAAWKDWSLAFEHILPTDLDQYGPLRMGPAYPLLFPGETAKDCPRQAGICEMHYNVKGWWERVSDPELLKKHILIIGKMNTLMTSGNRHMAAAAAAAPDPARAHAERMVALGEFILHTVRTVIAVKRWAIDALTLAGSGSRAEKMAALDEMETIAKDEMENALATIPLVECDSALGFEPRMNYMTDRGSLEWKVSRLRHTVDKIIPDFRRNLP